MLERYEYSHLQQQEQDLSLHLILYSKPGCHLCEGLQEKLVQIQSLDLTLDVRDITTRDDWFQAYQYEIPVLVLVRGEGRGEDEKGEAGEAIQNSKLKTQNSKLHPSSLIPLPRPSPRATVPQLEKMLRQYL
ncbi:MAG: glutaredoxin family protein [Stenomitos frigidus ULC029]